MSIVSLFGAESEQNGLQSTTYLDLLSRATSSVLHAALAIPSQTQGTCLHNSVSQGDTFLRLRAKAQLPGVQRRTA